MKPGTSLLSTLFLCGLAWLGGPPAAPLFAQENPKAAQERDLEALREEQALLTRQLERLKSTMEVLLARIEAEGRTRTAELLREGLTLLQARAEAAGGTLTPVERAQEARTAL